MLLGLLLAVSLRAAHELVGTGVLPALVGDLGGDALAGAFFAVFSATSALGILSGGVVADRYGPARAFAAGLAGFALGMLATGLAPSMQGVIAARALEGFGAGFVSCVVSAVVMRAYDDGERPRVLAWLSAAWVVPGLVAPALAVGVAAAWGWRVVFLGLVPLVGLAALLALPRLLSTGAAAPEAASPLRGVLGDPELRAALATRASVVVAFFGVESFLPLAYARVLGASGGVYATLLMLSALGWTAGAFLQARWNHRFGPTAFARLGSVLLLAGIVIAASALAGGASLGAALVAWSFGAVGMGVVYQTATAAAMRTSRPGTEGATGAVLGITDALAVAAATALCGAFLAREALAPGEAPRVLLAGYALVTALGLASLWTARRLRGAACESPLA